jgi:hypothetical protein
LILHRPFFKANMDSRFRGNDVSFFSRLDGAT